MSRNRYTPTDPAGFEFEYYEVEGDEVIGFHTDSITGNAVEHFTELQPAILRLWEDNGDMVCSEEAA